MKKFKLIISIIAITGMMISCGNDYLTQYPSGDVVAGAPATQDVIEQNLTGAYQILLFDCYANGQWMPVNGYFDLCSDDVYKGGGDAGDQGDDLLVAEFRSDPVRVRTGWWSIFYAGLKRCNGAIEAIDNAVDVQDDKLAQYRAQALTLRAYFVHWLWKAYGNIPYFDKAWTEEPFLAPQHSFDELYPRIIADLDAAINTPEFPMTAADYNLNNKTANRGRVTKAMAMMTKARVVLYFKDQSKYAQVLADMKTIITNGAFSLVTTAAQPNFTGTGGASTSNPFEWIFLRDGEFCSESIFEVNHYPEGKSWGGSWSGFGSYTPRFTGARALNHPIFVAGWGFCPVVPSAYAIFDAADYRRDASVIEFPAGTSDIGYQHTGLWLKKYIARIGYNVGTRGDRDLNYENNKRIYRIAEAYLNAAELEFYANGTGGAQQYLDAIRDRAFGNTVSRIPATLENIKLERHREFFGEGMRFWDLVRWGTDENGKTITEVLSVNDPSVPVSRTWSNDKRFLPIPQSEIDRTKGTDYELKQNPGYN